MSMTVCGGIEYSLALGTDFRQIADAEFRQMVKKLNNRPRKRLGYQIPAQVFLGDTQESWIPQVLRLLSEFRI